MGLHSGIVVRFPRVVRIHPASPHRNSLLCRGIERHEDPKVAGGKLNSSSVDSLLYLLREAFLLLELRPLGQQSRRSQEQEAKLLLVDH